MDVVHPSSDMKSAGPAQPVQAARPIEVPSAPAQTEIVDIVKPEPKQATPAPAFSWTETPSITSEPEVKELDLIEDTDVLESPFLTNTKVEKRPLGAFSADEPQSTPFLDLTDALKEEADAEIATQTASDDVTQPSQSIDDTPALNEESFDLETSEEKLFGIEEDSQTAEIDSLKLLEQPEARPLLEKDTTADSAVAARTPQLVQVSAPAVSLGVASIPQQYTEQPVSDDQPSGAIYDTESYHQPLSHPKKNNAGWLVIVWIVGLILFGAGIGAALYFFVLPML
jgi:hypothetical protein